MVVKRLHDVPPQIKGLYDRGVKSVIPLLKGKSPGYKDWQNITDEQAREQIWSWNQDRAENGKECNFGIRLGPSHGNITDVDLDSEESRRLAPHYLPDTAVFGRGGAVTHYLYRQTSGGKLKSRRFQWDKRDEKSVLLELRASGQTMGPGSVHPDTGQHIEWMNEEPIHDVTPDVLHLAVVRLAAASLLLRDWNTGNRDELAVCLVGSMVRAGWEDDDVDDFLAPILVSSGDEEGVKRFKSHRLREELQNDGRVPGLKRLREICNGGGLGQAGFERIVEWLSLGGGDMIEEMNRQYAIVSLRGGGVAIMRESSEGVEFMDRSAFSLLMSNRHVPGAGPGGRELTLDKFWIQHKDRREYLNGVVFQPGRPCREGEYNLWRGFSVDPVETKYFGEGWEIYRDHLKNEICDGDDKYFKWLIGWMAHRVQRPWEVPESSVVLIGERGDGKGTVFKILGLLFGRHYMSVTNPRHLMGNFNSHLMDKVLVFADEAVWGGDKTNEGILKVMISEARRVIEIKGKDAFDVENCTAYGIASNNDWVVPVGRYERRFFITRPRGHYRGNHAYFDKLYLQMESEGGLSKFLYDLKEWDLDGWRGNRPPNTPELISQMARGMEHWVQFLIEQVESTMIRKGETVWRDDLHDAYLLWMKKHHFKHPDTPVVFFKNVKRMFPSIEEGRGRRTVFAGKLEKVTRRESRYTFGDVVEEMKKFCSD